MIPSLQPHRPKVSAPPILPPGYQQIRQSHKQHHPAQAPPHGIPPIAGAAAMTAPLATKNPASQIEAMPPSTPPPGPRLHAVPMLPLGGSGPPVNPTGIPPPPPAFNSAICHPIFFTHSLRRPPFPVPAGPAAHPVTWGYIFDQKKPGTGHGSTML